MYAKVLTFIRKRTYNNNALFSKSALNEWSLIMEVKYEHCN